jgi:hypothetical protein
MGNVTQQKYQFEPSAAWAKFSPQLRKRGS